jgi:hypothetical protein
MPTASENIFRQVTLDWLITLTFAALAVLLGAILADDTRSNYRRACEGGT